MNTKNSLEVLGLSDKQIKTYQALLSTGPSPATQVAHEAGLKRTTTYTILDELSDMGLVAAIDGGNRNEYRALSPHLLVKQKKEELSKVEDIVPEIEAKLNSSGMNEKPHVKFFDGISGIKQIVNYKLKELADGELREMLLSVSEETLEKFDGFFEKYEQKLRDLNIKERGISPDTPEVSEFNEKYKQSNQDIIIVDPDMWSSPVAIEVGKSWVKMYDLDNLQGIIIQNTAIASAMQQMFDMSYETAKSRGELTSSKN